MEGTPGKGADEKLGVSELVGTRAASRLFVTVAKKKTRGVVHFTAMRHADLTGIHRISQPDQASLG
jgi:hypothetical protein